MINLFDCAVLPRRGERVAETVVWIVRFCFAAYDSNVTNLSCAGVKLTSASHASALSFLSGRLYLLAENFKHQDRALVTIGIGTHLTSRLANILHTERL